MAMTPTTMTCCSTSEKFSLLRKRSLWVAKKTHASSRAKKGPRVLIGGSFSFQVCAGGTAPVEVALITSCPSTNRCPS